MPPPSQHTMQYFRHQATPTDPDFVLINILLVVLCVAIIMLIRLEYREFISAQEGMFSSNIFYPLSLLHSIYSTQSPQKKKKEEKKRNVHANPALDAEPQAITDTRIPQGEKMVYMRVPPASAAEPHVPRAPRLEPMLCLPPLRPIPLFPSLSLPLPSSSALPSSFA